MLSRLLIHQTLSTFVLYLGPLSKRWRCHCVLLRMAKKSKPRELRQVRPHFVFQVFSKNLLNCNTSITLSHSYERRILKINKQYARERVNICTAWSMYEVPRNPKSEPLICDDCTHVQADVQVRARLELPPTGYAVSVANLQFICFMDDVHSLVTQDQFYRYSLRT